MSDPNRPTILDKAKDPDHQSEIMFRQAQQILADCPPELLERRQANESTFLLTPSFEPGSHSGTYDTPDVRELQGHSFSIAAIANTSGKPAMNSPYYIIIDGNVKTRDPLSIDPGIHPDSLLLPDVDGTTLSDKYVKEVITGIRGVTQAATSRHNDKLRAVKVARQRTWRRSGFGVLAGLVFAGGGYGAYSWHEDNQADEAAELAAAEKVITDYDAQGIRLPGSTILNLQGDPAFVESDQSYFNSTMPQYAGGDIPASPRRTTINAGSCNIIGRITAGNMVGIVSNAPDQSVTAFVDSQGNLVACAEPDALATKDDDGNVQQPTYDTAIQAYSAK
jgi:hypothetical protein